MYPIILIQIFLIYIFNLVMKFYIFNLVVKFNILKVIKRNVVITLIKNANRIDIYESHMYNNVQLSLQISVKFGFMTMMVCGR